MRKPQPDLGTPGRWHIDPSVKRYQRKVFKAGKIVGRSMGNYSEDEFEAGSGGRDWTGVPYLERCPTHFFRRDMLFPGKPRVCNCKERS